jgi:type VI secretion system protein ImpG
MSDELLPYYERELTYIRQLAAKFAEDHPKIAERLRIDPQHADDPHVERLIEAFAYLTARVRRKIDDEFPEIVGSMLDVLYPHYQAPIPSMAIARFEADTEQIKATTGFPIPPRTELETDPIGDEPCRFRTCYPVTLWPLSVKSATLMQPPFRAPNVRLPQDSASVLRLVISTPSEETPLASLGVRTLRFFLRGQPQHAFRLYELIFNNAIAVALAGSPDDADPILLGRDCLGQVGFESGEGLLEYPARSFLGYRLLTEFFAFPQKFLFVDLALPDLRGMGRWGDTFEAYVFLDRALPDVGRAVSAETFQLGCTPIVNLYKQHADPIDLSHRSLEYRVVPNSRLPLSHEVYSIDRVTASPRRGDSVEFHPFFSIRHAANQGQDPRYWHAARRVADAAPAGKKGPDDVDRNDNGTDVYISLVDPNFRPSAPANWTLEVETTCLNRDLPQKLPFGGDQPRLRMREGGTAVSRIACLTPPTRTLRPPLGDGRLWRLVSHLTLNHFSLVDGKAEALREILRLYDFADSAETRKQIEGVLQVGSRRVVGSVLFEGQISFCRGLEVSIQFSEDLSSRDSLFLFASVLERFVALYSTVNSFSKLIATVRGRDEELRRWPPRIGEKVLA